MTMSPGDALDGMVKRKAYLPPVSEGTALSLLVILLALDAQSTCLFVALTVASEGNLRQEYRLVGREGEHDAGSLRGHSQVC